MRKVLKTPSLKGKKENRIIRAGTTESKRHLSPGKILYDLGSGGKELNWHRYKNNLLRQ